MTGVSRRVRKITFCWRAACRRAGEGAEPGGAALFQELQDDLRAQLPGASRDTRTLQSLLDLPASWPALASADAIARLEDMALACLAAPDAGPRATLHPLGWVLHGFAVRDRVNLHRPARVFQAAAAWLAARDWEHVVATADVRAAKQATLLLCAFASAGVAPLPPAALGGLATLACRNAHLHAAAPVDAARLAPPEVASRMLDALAAVAMYPAVPAAARRVAAHGSRSETLQLAALGAPTAGRPDGSQACDGRNNVPERWAAEERQGALVGKLDGLVMSVVEGLRCDPAAPPTIRERDMATQAICALRHMKYRLSAPLAADLAACIPALAPSLSPGAVRRAAELLCAPEHDRAWPTMRAAVEALAARRAVLLQECKWPYGSDEPRYLQRALQRTAQSRA